MGLECCIVPNTSWRTSVGLITALWKISTRPTTNVVDAVHVGLTGQDISPKSTCLFSLFVFAEKAAPGHAACAGCDSDITDKHMLEVLSKCWHVKCLRCADCTQLLEVNCFYRDGDILCEHDFFRLDNESNLSSVILRKKRGKSHY